MLQLPKIPGSSINAFINQSFISTLNYTAFWYIKLSRPIMGYVSIQITYSKVITHLLFYFTTTSNIDSKLNVAFCNMSFTYYSHE